MRSIFPYITENSIKYLRSFVKSFPNKIYSVEIKIKSEVPDKKPPSSTSSDKVLNLNQKVLTNLEANKSQVSVKSISEKNSKIINVNDIDNVSHTQIIERTLQLVRSLKFASSTKHSLPALVSLNVLLQEISLHLKKHPEVSNILIQENTIQKLLHIRELSSIRSKNNSISINVPSSLNEFNLKHNLKLNENTRQVLTLLGHADPPKGRGIRVLSIDGGGTRGLVIIEILRQIEKICGKPIHQIFDLICGVSTGAIIAMLLGAKRISIDECEAHYRHVSSFLFKTDIVRGASRLLWSHAYYDTAVFEKILHEIYGETSMIHCRNHQDCPHIVAISAIVNLPTLQPYLFRNYELHSSSKPFSNFEGGSFHKIWEAVRASAAAPGYFEEFTVGKHVHQDGGILINNPTAVAIHEAKLLWPNEDIQCVLSLGSGRYQPCVNSEEDNPATLSSLKHKILRLIDSATDTEMVHRLMQDLLPPSTYYRINPILRDQSTIDEHRPEKLEQMIIDSQLYLRKNDFKFKKMIQQLSLERTFVQKLIDTIKLKSKIYLH